MTAFRQGLKEVGFVEGQNVAIEYRSAEDHLGRLPALVAELIRRPAAVIVGNTASALAAKAATTTVPIVFAVGGDPVALGLVASLNRPGSNVTGVSFLTAVLGTKQLELLRQLVPKATTIAMLTENPNSPDTEAERRDVQDAARAIGQQLLVLDVGSDRDIEKAFATFVQRGAGAVLVGAGAFFNSRRERLVALSARHALPASYIWREAAVAGGLMSYSHQHHRCLPPGRHLRRTHPQGREACRPAGHAGRPNLNSCSTSRPPRRSALMYRRSCSPSPTR